MILLVLAVWVPAVVGLALQARSTYVRQDRLARDSLRQVADNLNFAIETELDKRRVLAQALAATRAVQERDIARFDRQARAAVAGSHSTAFLVDRTHQYVYTALPGPRRVQRLPGAPFVTGAPEVIFSPRGPVTGKPVIALLVPESGRNPPEFNIGVPFLPQDVQAIVERQATPAGGVSSVIDAQQRVMARSRDPERWLGTVASNTPLRELAERGGSGYLETLTLDGVASLTYVAPRNAYGWQAVVALPMATLHRTAERLTLQALAASGVLLLIGLALAMLSARWISEPVLQLKSAADDLGREQVPPVLRSGVGELDDVSAALHAAGVRIQQTERVLEARVAEAVQAVEVAQAKLFEARKHEAIGRLTGGVAHDFNNLLQTISMGLQVVQRTVPEGTHGRALAAALSACGKAADLVRQMLAFGRPHALQPQAVALEDLLLHSRELTAKAAGERIRLVADVATGTPPVLADPTQLELALLNLVFNARDAMPQGGTVAIEARGVASLDAAQTPLVRIDVVDQGVGMDAPTLARVFEPYFTTKAAGVGTGLGLPQVQAFAKLSGGDVRIESSVGQGTRVSLFLPAATAGAPTREPLPAVRARPDRLLHVLMAEDDVLVGSVVPAALEREGHRVTLCRSADEARTLLEAGGRFDVLFTDVVMPGSLTGLDLVAWCREHMPQLPALVATGYSVDQPDARVRVVRKPYGIDELLAALHAAVSGAPSSLPA